MLQLTDTEERPTVDLADVTVIVPTKNEAHNIPVLLRSLPPEIALIVVDASADGTPDVVTALRPCRTTVIRCPGNIAEARQLGAEAARTHWLVYTDADIVFAADYFARLSTYYGYDALYGPKLATDAYVRYYRWMARAQRMVDTLGIPAASGSNLVVSRLALLRVGGFDFRLSCNEDTEAVSYTHLTLPTIYSV